jgi:hypothetical protein
MELEEEEPLALSELGELRAPTLGPEFTEAVLRRLPATRPVRRPTWFTGLRRSLAAAALITYLLLFLVLIDALKQPGAPGSLAPRLIHYWAGLPEVGPLDGGL